MEEFGSIAIITGILALIYLALQALVYLQDIILGENGVLAQARSLYTNSTLWGFLPPSVLALLLLGMVIYMTTERIGSPKPPVNVVPASRFSDQAKELDAWKRMYQQEQRSKSVLAERNAELDGRLEALAIQLGPRSHRLTADPHDLRYWRDRCLASEKGLSERACKKHADEIASVKKRLDKSTDERDMVFKTCQQLNAEVRGCRLRCEQLEQAKSDLSETVRLQLVAEADVASAARFEPYMAEGRRLFAETEEQRAKLIEMDSQLSTMGLENLKLRKLAQAPTDHTQCGHQHQATKKELQGAKQDLQTTKEKLEPAMKQLDATTKQLDETKKELEAAKKELAATRTDLGKTKKDLGTRTEELEGTKKELGKTREELGDAHTEQAQYALKRLSINELDACADHAQCELNLQTIKKELKEALADHAKCGANLQAMKKDLASKANHTQCEAKLRAMQKDLEARIDHEQCDVQVEALRKDLEAHSNHTECELKLQAIQKEFEERANCVDHAQCTSSAQVLRKELEAMTQELEATSDALMKNMSHTECELKLKRMQEEFEAHAAAVDHQPCEIKVEAMRRELEAHTNHTPCEARLEAMKQEFEAHAAAAADHQQCEAKLQKTMSEYKAYALAAADHTQCELRLENMRNETDHSQCERRLQDMRNEIDHSQCEVKLRELKEQFEAGGGDHTACELEWEEGKKHAQAKYNKVKEKLKATEKLRYDETVTLINLTRKMSEREGEWASEKQRLEEEVKGAMGGKAKIINPDQACDHNCKRHCQRGSRYTAEFRELVEVWLTVGIPREKALAGAEAEMKEDGNWWEDEGEGLKEVKKAGGNKRK